MRPTALLAALLLAALPAFPAAGDREDPPPATAPAGDVGAGGLADRITAAQQAAIDRGLRWLAAQQDPAGGFPSTSPGGGGNARSADYQTAVTALSTLAFLGAGHGLAHGEYHDTVYRAVDWLLKAEGKAGDTDRPRGYISFPNDRQSKMHGHGFATLALAEAFATAGDSGEPGRDGGSRSPETVRLHDISRRLRDGIQDAVDLIECSQALRGGWDYFPTSGGKSDHEGSITVCQVQALLAASNRGFRVDRERIELARKYMRDSQTASGGFKYKLTHTEGANDRQLTYALTAAGVVSILGLADWDRKEAIEKGMVFLERKSRSGWRRTIPHPEETPYYFYGSFYAVQAYHWLGGERWERFWVPMRNQILSLQNGNGSWTGRDTSLDLGDVYPTAYSLLMLEVPVRYLSIFDK